MNEQKTKEKIEGLSIILRNLKMTLSAVQVVNPEGIIEMKVIFEDREQYPVEQEQEPLVEGDQGTTSPPEENV